MTIVPQPLTLSSSSTNDEISAISASTSTTAEAAEPELPQVFATGQSTSPKLQTAITEAISRALSKLPTPPSIPSGAQVSRMQIDLALVFISSLYTEPLSQVVPWVLSSIEANTKRTNVGTQRGYGGVKHVIGGSAGGIIGTTEEFEGVPAVSITLALLPDVSIHTFHIKGNKKGVDNITELVTTTTTKDNDDDDDEPIFMILPTPAFQNEILISNIQYAYPKSCIFGGVTSTVSSLSRARIFVYSSPSSNIENDAYNNQDTTTNTIPEISTYGDGCIGLVMSGDIYVDTMIAQGAKPVGGVYRITATGSATTPTTATAGDLSNSNNEDEEKNSVAGSSGSSTISSIVLDELATTATTNDETDDNDERMNSSSSSSVMTESQKQREVKRSQLIADYAKARIPKPPLAEANFIMKRLSDDDQSFMRKTLLVGLERGSNNNSGNIGSGQMSNTNELEQLAQGDGHRYIVHQVASAGMKDGSVTFPLGSVHINIDNRCRFYVRDGDFAKKEVEALWMGYKKKDEMESSMTLLNIEEGEELDNARGPPTACLILPTLDRGIKLFGGKAGYESGIASKYLPSTTSIFGFFTNGVLGRLDDGSSTMDGANENMLHGSSSQYVVFRSKTRRPLYLPRVTEAVQEESVSRLLAASVTEDQIDVSGTAPRFENGELIVRRREIHSGRTLSVSTVEWSVAEKMAKPTSVLEGYMWEKETQVDRLRERVPLAQLMTNTMASMKDPKTPKPKDWIGSVIRAAGENGKFVIIPECKRMEPVSGSLRQRYDLPKLVKQLTVAGAPAISINSDGVLFGGSMDDITMAREASDAAALVEPGLPVLASDLLLYPYQLYKLRLAGADAVTIIVGALEGKDLLYLTKIARTVQLQVVASVTTKVQISMLNMLNAGSIVALVISNRDLETFDFDGSGRQALTLLQSEELKTFREKHGDGIPILVEGRVGFVGADGDSATYIKALKDAGAFGAIIGGGIATIAEEDVANTLASWSL
jgi:indole-3-glycerol phosphate synthase